MAGETTLEEWRARLLDESRRLRVLTGSTQQEGPIGTLYATLQGIAELHFAQRKVLVDFARELAACQWYSSPSFETTTEDRIDEATEKTKATIGETLLRLLGEPK